MNDSGSVIFDTTEKLELWRRHYAAIGSGGESLLAIDNQLCIMSPPPKITINNTENVLRMAKTKKPDFLEISLELFRVGGRPVGKIITKIFYFTIICGKCQKTGSATISIYKGKGDAMNTRNYRRLRMLETSFELFEEVIATKLLGQVEHKIGQQQRGFLAGRSTSDGIFILRQFEEKYRKVKRKLYCIFVDLAKPFDSVPRRVIWWVLKKLVVPEWIVKTI